MEQYLDYTDERNHIGCAFCGEQVSTVDHIPARAFLVKPYPENLCTIDVCAECNNASSQDEEYVAFLLHYLKLLEEGKHEELDKYFNTECNLKKERRLRKEDALFNVFNADAFGTYYLNIDKEAIKRVLIKYAKGHILYELGKRIFDIPNHIAFVFKNQIDDSVMDKFEKIQDCTVFPEVGSRLLQRIAKYGTNDWVKIQDGRYRYFIGYSPGISVKIVINELMLGEIIWEGE